MTIWPVINFSDPQCYWGLRKGICVLPGSGSTSTTEKSHTSIKRGTLNHLPVFINRFRRCYCAVISNYCRPRCKSSFWSTRRFDKSLQSVIKECLAAWIISSRSRIVRLTWSDHWHSSHSSLDRPHIIAVNFESEIASSRKLDFNRWSMWIKQSFLANFRIIVRWQRMQGLSPARARKSLRLQSFIEINSTSQFSRADSSREQPLQSVFVTERRATQKKRKLFIYFTRKILFKKYTRLVRSCELIHEAFEWKEWMNSMWWSFQFTSLNAAHGRQFAAFRRETTRLRFTRATAPERRPNNRDIFILGTNKPATRQWRKVFAKFLRPPPASLPGEKGKQCLTRRDHELLPWLGNFHVFAGKRFSSRHRRLRNKKTRSDLHKTLPKRESKWKTGERLDSSTHFNDTITF